MAPPSKYSPEFREEAVQLALESSKSVADVARSLGMHPETLRTWVRRHERDTWNGIPCSFSQSQSGSSPRGPSVNSFIRSRTVSSSKTRSPTTPSWSRQRTVGVRPLVTAVTTRRPGIWS
ncbi:transposase [Saccharopolyspora sp. ASAGF58]|uniref:transposase n=1 Tax=Saccharopolyspora sp. ASAGF58 TaxID=2719023 RepID=UPI0035302E9B